VTVQALKKKNLVTAVAKPGMSLASAMIPNKAVPEVVVVAQALDPAVEVEVQNATSVAKSVILLANAPQMVAALAVAIMVRVSAAVEEAE